MSRALELLGIVIATAVNAVVLFVSSLLATGGDGSADGVITVLIVGGLFVLGFTVTSLYRWWNGLPGVRIVMLALPAAYGFGVVFIVSARLLGFRVG